jgi:hypothetical protein
MPRHIGESVQVRYHQGQLTAFTWRAATYPVRVLDMWRLATRWWEPGEAADCTDYYYSYQAVICGFSKCPHSIWPRSTRPMFVWHVENT